jgi:hypothetical protein
MLSKNHFYWEMFRKYIVAFSHIIKDIHVVRTDANNVPVKDIIVPITYASKTKLFYYLQRNSEAGIKIKATVPRISFVIDEMVPDISRKVNNLNEHMISTKSGIESFQYTGQPYNFNISMGIWTVYMSDLLQIIEQLATFFKPDYSLDVKEIEELGITKSIPVILQGITFDIENEFEEDDRLIRADATFILKGWLYPAISNSKIIEHITLQMGDLDSREIEETIQLDWDRINEVITTNIKTGRPYFEFNSSVNIISNTECNN